MATVCWLLLLLPMMAEMVKAGMETNPRTIRSKLPSTGTACIAAEVTSIKVTECVSNKYIGDDTKAAARQSPNCIKKKQKINYGEKRFSIWRMELLHPAIWHDHDIDFAR